MRTPTRSIAFIFLLIILISTAGCAPRWAVTATRYAESISLYSASDPSQPVTQAAAGQHFLIVGMELQYSAAQPADIRDQLIFGLYDCYGDDVRYNNFYPAEDTIFDAISYFAAKDAPLDGSVFFLVPDSFTAGDAVLVVMNQYYDAIYSTSLSSLQAITDYPASW